MKKLLAVLLCAVAGTVLAPPVPDIPSTTTWSRQLLTNTTAAGARTTLALGATNMPVNTDQFAIGTGNVLNLKSSAATTNLGVRGPLTFTGGTGTVQSSNQYSNFVFTASDGDLQFYPRAGGNVTAIQGQFTGNGAGLTNVAATNLIVTLNNVPVTNLAVLSGSLTSTLTYGQTNSFVSADNTLVIYWDTADVLSLGGNSYVLTQNGTAIGWIGDDNATPSSDVVGDLYNALGDALNISSAFGTSPSAVRVFSESSGVITSTNYFVLSNLTVRPSQVGLNFVTPEQFGAVGDGTNDDTSAVQACVDYVYGTSLRIWCGKSYKISSPILWTGGLVMMGPASECGSTTDNTGNRGSTTFIMTNTATFKPTGMCSGTVFDGLSFSHPLPIGGTAITLSRNVAGYIGQTVIIRNCEFTQFGLAIAATNCPDLRIEDTEIWAGWNGIATSGQYMQNGYLKGVQIGTLSNAITWKQGQCLIQACDLYQNVTRWPACATNMEPGILVSGAMVNIVGGHIEQWHTAVLNNGGWVSMQGDFNVSVIWSAQVTNSGYTVFAPPISATLNTNCDCHGLEWASGDHIYGILGTLKATNVASESVHSIFPTH